MIHPLTEMSAPVMLLISAVAVILVALVGSGLLFSQAGRERSGVGRAMFSVALISGLLGFWAFVEPWDGRPAPRRGLFGRPAPMNQAPLADDWRWRTLEGNQPVSLHSLRGKVVVLNIWATWCPPCVQEMPSFVSLMDRFEKVPDVVFVFVSVDQDPDVVAPFLARSKLKIPVYFPEGPPPQRLQTSGIPATFVFGRDGRMVEKVEGSADWNDNEVVRRLKQLEAQAPPPTKVASVP